MADPTSRPWWKHPAVRATAAVVAVRLAGILLFRIRNPRIVAVEDVPGLTRYWRALSQVYAIREWLVVTAAAEQPSTAAPATASAGTSAPPASSPSTAAAR